MRCGRTSARWRDLAHCSTPPACQPCALPPFEQDLNTFDHRRYGGCVAAAVAEKLAERLDAALRNEELDLLRRAAFEPVADYPGRFLPHLLLARRQQAHHLWHD
eukprot:287876-Prymnesium_polylepis.2